jgi:GT2 family glycosyltransferase
MILKILLPAYEDSTKPDTFDRIYKEIRKAGVPYSLLVLVDRDNSRGELPARNDLFRMALLDEDWEYCVTLSNDIYELPNNWARNLELDMEDSPKDVGALNAFGFVNTFYGCEWAQTLIDEDGQNLWLTDPSTPTGREDMMVFGGMRPPNPELSTACCIIRREVLEKVGLFDPGFGRGGGMEHWDYVIRMYQAGYQNLLTYAVTFKADIKNGNNFKPNDTTTYYREKWGTGLDGLPTKLFVEKAKYTSPSAGFTPRGRKNVGFGYTNCPCSTEENPY